MAQMVCGMLTDKVDNRHLSPMSVMQIGEAVAEAGAKVKECTCWPASHTCVAISSSSHHAFKEAENTAHFPHLVEGGNNMNF
jgi:hypothetical protein